MLEGSCHCGAIMLAFDTARDLNELPVRVCGCTFCARHRPSYTTDPSGQVIIRATRESELIRYRFGLRLADFLICRRCGVFVAALDPGPPVRAIVNLAVLDRASEFTSTPVQFAAYDSEDVPTRTARRARSWTPATLMVGA
jgi:hypothetical protein